jgi:hypothetical protein
LRNDQTIDKKEERSLSNNKSLSKGSMVKKQSSKDMKMFRTYLQGLGSGDGSTERGGIYGTSRKAIP